MNNNFKLYKKIFQEVNHLFGSMQRLKKDYPEFIPFIDKMIDWFFNYPSDLYDMFYEVIETQDPYLFLQDLEKLILHDMLNDQIISVEYIKTFHYSPDHENFLIKKYGPKKNWKKFEGHKDIYYINLDKLPEDKDCKIKIINNAQSYSYLKPDELVKLMDIFLEIERIEKEKRIEFFNKRKKELGFTQHKDEK